MKNYSSTSEKPDWKEVLIDIILKVLTLGFYHVEKNKKS